MRLLRMVIHNIVTEVGEADVRPEISEALLPVEPQSEAVAKQLADSYGKKHITYAKFDRDPEREFPRSVHAFQENSTDQTFLSFSQERTRHLGEMMRNIPQARGGYVVYVEYRQDAHHFLAIFFVRNTEGVLFRHDPATRTFIIDPSIHIDIDKLVVAARISLAKLRLEPDANHISFIRRTPDFSNYFVRWLAATQLENAKAYTNALYDVTTQIPCPQDDNEQPISRDDFRKQIYDYVVTQPNRIVNLRQMSEHFYQDPDFIPGFLEMQDIRIDTEFKAHPSSMNKFVKVDVRADGIEMKFSRGDARRKVQIDDEQVIIKSQLFTASLRQALNEPN